MSDGGGDRGEFAWTKGRLPDDEWPKVWNAFCAHGLGLANVKVWDWSVEDAVRFLRQQPGLLILARLALTERDAYLIEPNVAADAIAREFEQDAQVGSDLGVLPTDFAWCVHGNADGELYYCVISG